MLKIRGLRHNHDRHQYECLLMEEGGSLPFRSVFRTDAEMIDVINDILSTQKRRQDIRFLMNDVRSDGCYFFDLDLTVKQAKALGWEIEDRSVA